jgi:hypothetical protein
MKHYVLWIAFSLLIFAVTASAQVTSLTLNSDPGDFIGEGKISFFTPDDGNFTAFNFTGSCCVNLSFQGQFEFWSLQFASPSGLLTVGTYASVEGQPVMNIFGDGRACNTLTGSFTVLEASFAVDGSLLSLDATFEQHCDGAVPALRGEIRFNAHPVVVLNAPTHLTAIQNQNMTTNVAATDALGRHVVLSATNLPAGATFIDNGDNTGTLRWTPSSNQEGGFLAMFQGDNLLGNVSQTGTHILVLPPPPPNDDIDNATMITAIPFTARQDVVNATVAPDDPPCFNARSQTIWFAFTPTQNIKLEANTFGSDYDTALSVYSGRRGSLTPIACNNDSNETFQSRVRFDAMAGTTYFFEVSSFFQASPVNLVFTLMPAPPPFSISPSVTQFGSVVPATGKATVSGFVFCTEPTAVVIVGELNQTHAGTQINGFVFLFMPCNGTTPWSTAVETGPVLFHGRSVAMFTGGKATVSARAFAFDFDTGISVERDLNVEITLRGKE